MVSVGVIYLKSLSIQVEVHLFSELWKMFLILFRVERQKEITSLSDAIYLCPRHTNKVIKVNTSEKTRDVIILKADYRQII